MNSIDPRTVLSYSLQKQPQDTTTKDLKALRESSREFESLYIMEMYKTMRKATPEGGLFEKSMATDIFQEMLDMETAKAAAGGKGMGIGEAMYNQLADQLKGRK